MSTDYCCGAECESLDGAVHGGGFASQHIGDRVGAVAVTTAIARNGGRAWRFNTVGAPGEAYITKDVAAGGTARTMRFYVYFNSLPSADSTLLQIATADSVMIRLNYRSGTQDIIASANNNGGTAGSVATPVVAGQFYLIDFKGDCGSGTRSAAYSVDGVAKGTATSAVAASTITRWRLGGVCITGALIEADVIIDDILTANEGTSYPLGASQIIGLLARADGVHNYDVGGDFKYSTIGNVPLGATDTFSFINHRLASISTFISTASTLAAGEYLEWLFDAMPAASVVRALEIASAHHAASTLPNKQTLRLIDGAQTADVFTDEDFSITGLGVITKHYNTRIGGLGALTQAAINGLKLRWGSSWTAPDVSPDAYIDGIVLEVDYQPSTGLTIIPEGLRMAFAMPEGLSGFDRTVVPLDRVGLGFTLGVPSLRIEGGTTDPEPVPTDDSFTAASVLETARDRHASFDRQRHPDPLLLRFLDRAQRSLLGKAIQRNSVLFAATHTFTFPLLEWAAGVAIPFTYHMLLGGEAVLIDGARLSFDLVPYGQRDQPVPFYSGWVLGTRLYFKGSDTDWGGVTGVELSYVPTVAKLSSLRGILGLPRAAEPALVEAVAAFMAGRGHTDPALPAIDEAAFILRAEKEEEHFLREVAAMRRSQIKTIREAW